MKKIIMLLLGVVATFALYPQPGSLDMTFNQGDLGFGNGEGPNYPVYAMAMQTDGKIIIGGEFTTYNGVSRNRIARLHADGTLDHSFDPGTGFGMAYWDGSCVYAIHVHMNGKILIGGLFHLYNGQSVSHLVQLNADGSLDTNFNIGTGPSVHVSFIKQQNDGRILIGGNFTSFNGISVNNLARLHQDGSLDDSFQGPAFEHSNWINHIHELTDGRILVGGDFYNAGETTNHNFLIRLLSNGSIDTTFNANFIRGVWPGGVSPYVNRIHVTDDNKYMVTGMLLSPGMRTSHPILRLNEDGSVDEEFEAPSFTPPIGITSPPWLTL